MKWLRKLFGKRKPAPEDPEAAMKRRREAFFKRAKKDKESGRFDLNHKSPPAG